MKNTKRILVTFLAAVTAVGAHAYSFRHLTARDGLSSNTVRAMLQDHLGLIWIGTANGLDSYDGREVVHHPLPSRQSAYVNCLLEDAQQRIWAGTDEGVYRMEGNRALMLEDYPGYAVQSLAEDREGNLWIASPGYGVLRYDGSRFTTFLEDQGAFIESLWMSAGGTLWVLTTNGQDNLWVFNAAGGHFVRSNFNYRDCAPARVCAIDEDSSGNLWMGTWDKGLYRLEAGSRTVTCAVPGGKGFTHVHSIIQESPFVFLIGSDDGLLRVNPLTGERTLYVNERNNPASLSNKFVYPIVKDHENGLWIGTYYGGVDYVSPSRNQFSTLSLSDLAGADEDFSVSCFCEDTDGSVWMGSDNGGLFRYDPARGEVARWSAPLSALNIHALCRRGDDLWIGTYAGNLFRLHLPSGRLKEYDGSVVSVYSLYNNTDGTLWAGTTTEICRYDEADDRFVPLRSVGDQVSVITGEQDGTLWFGTNGKGVLSLGPDGSWTSFTTENSVLPGNFIHSLLVHPDGICAGTSRGAALLGSDPAVLLGDTDVKYIAYDGHQLWMSTPSALLRYHLRSGERETYGSNDGVNISLFITASGLVTADGRIYMGASDGFLSFFPGHVKPNLVPPTVLITRFFAASQGKKENVFAQYGTDGDIRLPWRTQSIELGFAALSYIAPEKVNFRYRLEGRNAAWIPLGNQNRLTLSQLPPGRYRLHVQACNNSGLWNETGASVSFTLLPHPLLSHTAFVCYVLLAALLVWLVLRYFVRRMERQSEVRYEEKLDAVLSHVKEEERDDRYQFISSLAEQLEAPVSGIALQLEKIGRPAAYRQELSVIEKNQRMLRNIAGNLRQMKASMDPDTAGEQPASRDDGFMAQLDKLINENLSNPELSVSFLAKEMAVSRSGLFAKAKQLSGETPNNLINQARLNAAAALLREGKHSVGEICYMTGFSSPSYFSKIFAGQFGLSPHEWAKKNAD